MDDKLKEIILDEILRLSKAIYDGIPTDGCTCGNCRDNLITLSSFTINQLAGVLKGNINVDDFHDTLSHAPKQVRDFYIDLLFIEK